MIRAYDRPDRVQKGLKVEYFLTRVGEEGNIDQRPEIDPRAVRVFNENMQKLDDGRYCVFEVFRREAQLEIHVLSLREDQSELIQIVIRRLLLFDCNFLVLEINRHLLAKILKIAQSLVQLLTLPPAFLQLPVYQSHLLLNRLYHLPPQNCIRVIMEHHPSVLHKSLPLLL